MSIICSARERAEIERRLERRQKIKNEIIGAVTMTVLFTLLFLGWAQWYEYHSQPSAADEIRKDENRREALHELGQQAVRLKLKDPASAQFKGMIFNQPTDGPPISCGYVNARNSFGGYNGYTRYVYPSNSALTVLEAEVKDFQKLWEKLCYSHVLKDEKKLGGAKKSKNHSAVDQTP